MKIAKHIVQGTNGDKVTMIMGKKGSISISAAQGDVLDPMVVLGPKEGFVMALKMLYHSAVGYVLS